jgi:hypothetical protein
MPSVSEQMAMPASRTNPERIAARFLLKPGRKYEDAVKAFQPYDSTKEINDDARKAGASLVAESDISRLSVLVPVKIDVMWHTF